MKFAGLWLKRSLSLLLGTLTVLSCSATIMEAQVLYGTLVGNVTDASGGAVVPARVKLVNRGTRLSVETVTNTTGLYTFPNITAGSYDLTVAAPGFATMPSRESKSTSTPCSATM